MVRGLMVMILVLFITSAITITDAGAQQTPSNNNPNKGQMMQLRQEMQGLQQQIAPLRSQMQQLMTQVKALREQMHPIVEKMRTIRQQMRVLHGEHGQYQPQGGQGQWQHPPEPTTNSVAN
jgi:peptidoglycan hydrolase CwlO-like protein